MNKAIKMTAEERLNEILFTVNNKNLTQKVGSVIHKFHIRMNALNHLEKDVRTYYMMLLYNDTKKSVRVGFDGRVRMFLLNTLAGKFREVLKKI